MIGLGLSGSRRMEVKIKNKLVDMTIDLTPREVAEIIWEMDSSDQVQLLARLSMAGKFEDIVMQMQHVSDDLNTKADATQRLVRSFVDKLYEYLHE